jgi:carotenoid 1,2-hydratase
MTERGPGALRREAGALAIGRSTLHWDGGGLVIGIDEVAAPLPARIRGTVRVHPAALNRRGFMLDGAGRHRWRPIAPSAEVEVELRQPGCRWRGPAYLDSNDGDEALERAFPGWSWSRARLGRDTAVLYDVARRDGSSLAIATRFRADGSSEDFAPPPAVTLPSSRWRIPRRTRADGGHSAAVRETVLDAPFYARSVLSSRLLGEPVAAMHESLSLDRFAQPWVQLMLPFRMPRRPG